MASAFLPNICFYQLFKTCIAEGYHATQNFLPSELLSQPTYAHVCISESAEKIQAIFFLNRGRGSTIAPNNFIPVISYNRANH